MIYGVNKNNGAILILTIVFGSIFMVLFGGFAGFILTQSELSRQKIAWQESLEIAEAGLNYYRWHFAHSPDDLTDGTGLPGPYVHQYSDPEEGEIGEYSLEISGASQCGVTSGITISSSGWTDKYPDVKRTVQAKYVRSTVADYSFIINDNVWVGADHQIKGPYHSNGGIRFDGTNNSLVTSAKETWQCTSSFGCNPAQEKPGIFGDGPNSDLWRFPVPPFDFNAITMDLAQIKSLTQDGQGLYFGPSGTSGYHIYLNDNRTLDVYAINSLSRVWSYNLTEGWRWEYSVIASESFLGNYNIPAGCGLIFMEDDVWVSGLARESRIKGKITIVSADLINPSGTTDVWIGGDIESTLHDGSDGLVLIAERNNLIVSNSPDDLNLDGVYVAQTGLFGRNHYSGSEMKKDKLTIYGSVVSNGRVGTKWSCNGIFCSGYRERETNFDPELSFAPPPFLPAISEEYELKEWEEIE